MASVFLGTGEQFNISNNNVTVIGASGTGTEVVTVAAGVTGLKVDQAVERVAFSGSSASYTYQQQGINLVVYSGANVVATIPLQADANGTLLTFSNGTVEAKVGASGMTLGGTAVVAGTTSTTATAVTPQNIDSTGVTPPSSTFTLTAGAASVTEGSAVAFTLTASASATTDRTYTVSLVGDNKGNTVGTASVQDFPAVAQVTLLAGQTTATFSITPNANDGVEGLEGFKVAVLDSAFNAVATSSAVVVTDATTDITPPVVTIAAASYPENTAAGTLLATAVSNEAGSTFAFAAGSNAAGYFALDAATGKITLTAAGAAAAVANDFETTPTDSTFTLGVTARDVAGNVSTATNAVLTLTNVDDDAPVFTSAIVNATTLVLAYGETLSTTNGVPANSAFSGTMNVNGVVTNLNVTGVAVSGSTVTLTLGTSVPVGATVSVSYTAPAVSPLTDAAGNKVAALVNQIAVTDAVVPTLTSSSPADNATNVAVGANVVLTFSETVRAGTGNITIVNAGNAADTRTISVTDTTQVSFSGNTVTINPTLDLVTATSYYVNIPATAITDTIGNQYVGIVNVSTLDFSTPGTIASGALFPLTQGVDTVTGTAGDDTINAFLDNGSVTFQSTDVIAGNAGIDTLTALGLSGAIDFTQTTGVEKFVIGVAGFTTVNFLLTVGETSITVQNPVAGSQFTNIGMVSTGFDLGVTGGAQTQTFDFAAATTGGTTDTVRLALNGVSGNVFIDNGTASSGNAIEIVSITTSGANSSLASLNLSTAVNRLNIAGDKNFTSPTALAALVTTVDASSATGNVSINHSANANTLTFTGGSGSDTLRIGANLTTADTLTGGLGTDTLQVSQALVAADLTNVSGFEVFGINGADVVQNYALIASKFANTASIGSANSLTLNNITTGLVVNANATGSTVVLGALAASSATDTATINIGGALGNVTVASITRDGDIETLTINSQGITANSITTLGTNVNATVTGATALTVLSTGSLTGTLDAGTMTGGLTATTSTTALTVLGSTVADTITSGIVATGVTQTLNGNGGNDIISANAVVAAGAIININGGAGNDTITGPTGGAAVVGVIDGGTGNDFIAAGGSTGVGAAGIVIRSFATTVADADVITGFNTGVEGFRYSGALVNGSTTVVAGNVVSSGGAAASLNADLSAVLVANPSAFGYIVGQNLTGTVSTALNNLAAATTSVALTALYATFETELVSAIAGTVAGLDTVLATNEQVLFAFDNNVNSIVLRITNTDQSVANTLTGAEIELVGVFNGVAQFANADFL